MFFPIKNRIILISHTKGLYGANRNNLRIADTLIKKNYSIIFFTPYNDSFCKVLKEKSINYIAFNRFTRYPYWVIRKNKQKLIILIDFFRDIISLICSLILTIFLRPSYIISLSSTINVGARTARYLKINHIWYIQEFVEEDYNYKFKKGSKSGYKYIVDNSKIVITVSKALQNKILLLQPHAKQKIFTIPNGIPDLNIEKKIIDDRLLKLLFIGILSPGKRPLDAVRAISYLSNNYKLNVKLTILGDGVERTNIEEEIKLNKLTKLVVLEGFKEDIVPYLKEADIGIISSQNEAFGLVTLEYMMAKMPVIGSNSGATSELIDEYENGLLFKPLDIIDLAKKIKYFYDNPSEIKRMGSNSYNKFKTHFTIKNYDRLISFIEN